LFAFRGWTWIRTAKANEGKCVSEIRVRALGGSSERGERFEERGGEDDEIERKQLTFSLYPGNEYLALDIMISTVS